MNCQKIARSSEEMIDYYEELATDYPIVSIEDPLDEEDWEGWELLTTRLGQDMQLVGDDLFVTNVKRLKKGIDKNVANAILVKLINWYAHRSDGRGKTCAKCRVSCHRFPSFGRDGRLYDRRSCSRIECRAD